MSRSRAPPRSADGQWVSGLARWLPQQRWYPSKGVEAGEPSLRSSVLLAAADDEVVALHVVAVAPEGPEVLLSVPLVYRREGTAGGADGAEPAFTLADADGSTWRVLDGPHDPAFVAALVALLDGGVAGAASAEDPATAAGHLAAGASAPEPGARSSVLRGEQSNTSIIIAPDHGPPVIVKVFRVLAAGDNPDVVVQAALARVGCDRIPAPVGWVEGTWAGPAGPTGAGAPVHGHLAVAAEFVPGAQDAWREALAAAEAGTDFADGARSLGEAVGQVHAALARALPTTVAAPQDRAAAVEGLRERVAWAVAAAPVLARHAEALTLRLADPDALFAPRRGAGGGRDDLVLQQVHGDLHLGQVLHAPGRGWLLLDFEGEPLRPLATRTRPDLALRDVAGMLRSFDYAGATAARAGADATAARAWTDAARDAFCAGWAIATGSDPRDRRALLEALELDKAVYEVVYETRNRPAWVEVPLSALDRLLDARSTTAPDTCEAPTMATARTARTTTADGGAPQDPHARPRPADAERPRAPGRRGARRAAHGARRPRRRRRDRRTGPHRPHRHSPAAPRTCPR